MRSPSMMLQSRRWFLGALATLTAALPSAGQANTLRVISRSDWGAVPALPGLQAHTPQDIIIHHTAVPQKPQTTFAAKLRNLQAFSQREEALADGRMKPAWADLPYHYYIDWSGAVAEGRDVRFKGDTNTRYETAGHIQVVLEGNFDVERPADAQIASLRELVARLQQDWGLPPNAISAHKDHAQTNCPGTNLVPFVQSLRRP
jgi:N-acetylmuramoyl-L-alanine amidase